jgi:phospholipid transport system substrate-binding protein
MESLLSLSRRVLRHGFFALSVALFLGNAGQSFAQASSGAADGAGTVRTFYETLLATMQNGQALGAKGRYNRLEPAVQQSFDLPYMTRMVVGARWSSLTPEQQKTLTTAFGRFVTANYASNFNKYSGERLQVLDSKPSDFGAIVESRIVKSTGEPVAINYLVRQDSGDWKISDVYLAGTISELTVRRSEFTAILREQGPDALAGELNRKADALLTKSTTGS